MRYGKKKGNDPCRSRIGRRGDYYGKAVQTGNHLVSVFAIRFLMSYIRKKDFTAFGIYRIILGILVLLYFMIK